MVVGILQFELLIHEAESLKDKRRVVLSVKDRLHREHQASVAEVDAHDMLNRAVLGLAVVGRDGRRVGEVLDQITAKLRGLHGAELGGVQREILYGAGHGAEGVVTEADGSDGDFSDENELDRTLRQEMFDRAGEADTGMSAKKDQAR